MATADGFGERLRLTRQRWDWTQEELARRANLGVATIRRAEGGKFEPRLATARRLADALVVRVEWLLTGDEPMVSLAQLTADEQHRAQSGPATERLPGHLTGGPGPWYRDSEEWQVDRSRRKLEETN